MNRTLILAMVVILAVLVVVGLKTVYSNEASKASIPIPSLSHWADSSAQQSPQVALAQYKAGRFGPLYQQRLSVGFTKNIHWVHFRIGTGLVPADWVFEIDNLRINRLTLFRIKADSLVSLGTTGDAFVFAQRPIPTRTFAYPIHLEAYEQADFLLKIDKRQEDLSTAFYLWTATRFEQNTQREYSLWGIFLGFGILLLVVNTIFWRVTQDNSYLWYNIYTLTFGLRQFTDVGLGFQYLWPNLPLINQPDPVIQSLWLYLPAFITFSILFLELHPSQSRSYRVLILLRNVFLVLFVLVVIAQLTGIPQRYTDFYLVVFRTHAVLSTPIILLNLWSAFEQSVRRKLVVFLYTVAVVFQLVAQLFILYQNLVRNQPDAYFAVPTYLLLMVVFVVDVIIFSCALGIKFGESLRQNEALQANLIKAQEEQQQRLIDALEGERQRIVQDLEDDVGGLLQSARLRLRNIPELRTQQSQYPALLGAERLIEKGYEDLKNVSLNLLPIDFAQIGLAGALAEVVAQVNRPDGIRFGYELVGKVQSLGVATEVQLYRMANELINNVLKHSKATEASLRLLYGADTLRLVVQDNGRGFAATPRQTEREGIGVSNLYARAEHLQATLHLDSGEYGTRVSIEVNIVQEAG